MSTSMSYSHACVVPLTWNWLQLLLLANPNSISSTRWLDGNSYIHYTHTSPAGVGPEDRITTYKEQVWHHFLLKALGLFSIYKVCFHILVQIPKSSTRNYSICVFSLEWLGEIREIYTAPRQELEEVQELNFMVIGQTIQCILTLSLLMYHY